MDEDGQSGEGTSLVAHDDPDAVQTILDGLPDGVYVLEEEGGGLINERVVELLGTDRADAEAVDRLRSLFGSAHERALERQEPVTADVYDPVTDAWLETHIEPAGTSVTGCLRDVGERKEHDRRVDQQRERMEGLRGVYSVMRAINGVIVTDATRDELERITCETLADEPGYEFAFVAAVDSGSGNIVRRAEAGVEGYVDRIPLSTDPDDPAGRGPAGRAIRSQQLQVSNDVLADPDFEPWREEARELGYRSAAAIPIVHEGGLYGVLGVAGTNRNAFTDQVAEGLGQLGDVLGHAIAAIERKRALMSDQLIELEYEIADGVGVFDGPSMDGHRVDFERVVQVDDDRFLEFGVTAAETFPKLETLADCIPHWKGVEPIDESAGEVTFELEIASPPMFSVVASHGGYVESAALEAGDYRVTVHLPESADVRAVTEAIREVYPEATNVARRQVTPSEDSIAQLQDHLYGVLTDRQRTVLETAYYAGFFEWPRHSSGEEIAETLGITPATFHEHLRSAQHKIVAAVFNEPNTTRAGSERE
ncbi:bacterio-opsin activator domain-containing protein [Natronococcus occultus]|uniref:Putative DNA binding protein n=1 Tax=Natronococcus occultus SP4 TaxID=694430 RepID=L0JYM0_9EURY|nr:bacterio-opsin activator domain-containing protein [Natronococcus occultus]AGB37836.1 putative DNA binding protein [Natronococcus occultus SP4]